MPPTMMVIGGSAAWAKGMLAISAAHKAVANKVRREADMGSPEGKKTSDGMQTV